MKTVSLILTVCALPFAVLVAACWKAKTAPVWLRWAVVLLILAGGINTTAYVASMPASRFGGGRGAVQIPADHFDTLTYLRHSTGASALIIDETGREHVAGDPAAIVAARRVALPVGGTAPESASWCGRIHRQFSPLSGFGLAA